MQITFNNKTCGLSPVQSSRRAALGAGTFSSAQGFVYVGKWVNDVANDTAGRMIFKVGLRERSSSHWVVEPSLVMCLCTYSMPARIRL